MLTSSFKKAFRLCSVDSCYEGLLVLHICTQCITCCVYYCCSFYIAILQVKPEKVNLIIGSGGKKVKSIIEETGVEGIDTQDDGTVS